MTSNCFNCSMALAFVALTTPLQAQHIGEKRTTATRNVVAVYAITRPNSSSNVSADVEVCAGPNAPAYTFAFPSYFQLRFENGGAIAPWGSAKKPALERTPLQPKQCARGWLDFAVVSGQKPVSIHYHEAGADKKPIDWDLR